uniref:WSC domain-containing protein n=1 Tax=Macrostomum lignano TaxID=282301 RepID=A0A1I8IQU1_9PLAT
MPLNKTGIAAVAMAALLISGSLCQRKATPVYVGCFVDRGPPNRDMQGLVGIAQLGPFRVNHVSQGIASRADMTVELCSEIGIYGGFRYMAVQSNSECSCDSSYVSWGPAPEFQCNQKCRGNSAQMCGGAWRNSIYENVYSSSIPGIRFRKFATSAAPKLVTTAAFAGSLGWDVKSSLDDCAVLCARSASCSSYRFNSSSGLCRLSSFATAISGEAGDFRVAGLVGIVQLGPFSVTYMAQAAVKRADMTVELSSEICVYGGFRHCMCGSSYCSWGPAPDSECSTSCSGNAGQICGGGFRNSIYENFQPTRSPINFRKFAASAAPPLVTTAAFAGSLGWDVKTQSRMQCAAFCARTASCSSYRFNSSSGLCHISSFATAFANETGDLVVVVAALLVSGSLCQRKATPAYVGCFVDQGHANRDMLGLVGIAQLGPFSISDRSQGLVIRSDMTVQLCYEICVYGGFRYFGVQHYSNCVCDSSYGSWGPTPESECSTSCSGNAGQICGGTLRNSIYENVHPLRLLTNFHKFAAFVAPPLVTTAEFAGSMGWERKAESLVDCADYCARTASCSSFRFNSSSGLCRLSSFATAFANETGDVSMQQCSRTALLSVAVAALLVSGSLCQRRATPVYVGCFRDRAAPSRDLRGLVGIAQLGPFSVTYMAQAAVKRADMTVQLCSEICVYGGFRYFGLQHFRHCMCGSSYGSSGPAPDSECSTSCSGNAGQICGGGFRNSIYENFQPTRSPINFRKFAASAAPPLVTTAAFAGSLGWDVKTQSRMQCAAFCARTASCSSYRFNSSSGLCRLSSFATAFANETGYINFRKFAASAAPPLVTTAAFAGSLGWDVKTQSRMKCTASCARTASCSSYRFNSSSGLCRLSSFATAFANETGYTAGTGLGGQLAALNSQQAMLAGLGILPQPLPHQIQPQTLKSQPQQVAKPLQAAAKLPIEHNGSQRGGSEYSAKLLTWLKAHRMHKYHDRLKKYSFDRLLNLDRADLEAEQFTQGAIKKLLGMLDRVREIREVKEVKEVREVKEVKEGQGGRGGQGGQEGQGSVRKVRESGEVKEVKEVREVRETGEVR